jgi:hypothetical protein
VPPATQAEADWLTPLDAGDETAAKAAGQRLADEIIQVQRQPEDEVISAVLRLIGAATPENPTR